MIHFLGVGSEQNQFIGLVMSNRVAKNFSHFIKSCWVSDLVKSRCENLLDIYAKFAGEGLVKFRVLLIFDREASDLFAARSQAVVEACVSKYGP